MISLRDELMDSADLPFGEFLRVLYLPFFWIFVLPVMLLGTSLFETVTTTALKPDVAHVPTFYAPDTDSSGDIEAMLFLIALPIVATGFGALHLLAWDFQFPSHIERLLWRIASLTITGIPAVPLALELAVCALVVVAFVVAGIVFSPVHIVNFLRNRYDFPDFPDLPESVEIVLAVVTAPIWIPVVIVGVVFALLAQAIEWVAEPLYILAMVIYSVGTVIVVGILLPAVLVAYMVARLVLLSQAVILLREQPASAFHAVNWTRYFPHI